MGFNWGRERNNFVPQSNYNLLSSENLLILLQLIPK